MTDLEIIKNLEEIQSESSSNAKEVLLARLKNEPDFIRVLKYLYDTQYTFGISDKKINKQISVELKKDCNSILEVFEYLENNNTGTDFDIKVVQNFIEKFEKTSAQKASNINTFGVDKKQILIQMFCRKFKMGITEKTLEKVFPEDFTKFEVMKGEPYWDRIDKIAEEKPKIILSQKLDGIRCIARVEDGKVKLFARSGKLITGLKDLEKELSTFPNGAYDGELLKLIDGSIVDKSKFPEKALCHKIYCPKNAEELYSDTVSIVNSKDEDKKDIGLFLFDITSLENFDKKLQDNTTTTIRKQRLEVAVNCFGKNYVKLVPNLYEGDFDEVLIKKMLDEIVVLEQEGLMLNYANAPYVFKRTNYLVKVKQVYTADVKVIGFEEGTGKNKGKLGAFLVKTPQGVTVKVGSGLTDKDREDVWKNQAGYIGCIAEIAFTTPSTSKDSNLYNLRFPRFVRWRTDKVEENWEEFDKLILDLNKKMNKGE